MARDVMIVGSDDVPLLGISGRQVTTMPRAAEVSPQGERGPYTIVSWRGRIGFVLTDQLRRPGEPAEEDTKPESVNRQTAKPRGFPWLRTLFLTAAAAAGSIGTAFFFFFLG